MRLNLCKKKKPFNPGTYYSSNSFPFNITISYKIDIYVSFSMKYTQTNKYEVVLTENKLRFFTRN